MSIKRSTPRELTKEMIIGKARSMFVKKGFQEVSMRSIAKQLGCTHGALYYHFKNKAELFYAIVEVDFSTLNDLLEKIVQGPEEDSVKLKNIFHGFIEFGLNHQSQYEIMFIVRNTEVDGLAQKAANISYENFAQSIQSLSTNQLTVAQIWSAFIAIHGFVAHFRGYVDSYDEVKGIAESHVNFILRGLFN